MKSAPFWICPRTVTANTSFYAQYIRPEGGGPACGGWIGLYKIGAGPKDYVTYYGDTDARASTSISWSKGPPSPGDWEMRYYDKQYKLLASSPIKAVAAKIHQFTSEFASSDNTVTLASKHPQSPLWPAYLPVDVTRLLVMERSKNPSLVVYYANLVGARQPSVLYTDAAPAYKAPPAPLRCEASGEGPVLVRWYSWGWTAEPELNALSSMQVSWMGVKFKAAGPGEYKGVLNALASKDIRLAIGTDPTTKASAPLLITTLGAREVVLRKVFVKTTNSLIPRLEYADLYGVDLKTGEPVQERLKQ